MKNLAWKEKLKFLKKKKVIIPAAVVVIGAAAIIWAQGGDGDNVPVLTYDDTTVLAKSDMENTVSATGTVESQNSHYVYTTLSYPVDEVFVEVGNQVSANDVLCKLDSSSLEDQIESRQLALETAQKTSNQQVKTAQDSFNSTKEALEKDENSSVISSRSSVRTAYDNWEKAKKTYDDYYASKKDGLNSTLIAQDSAVETARLNLESAQDAYDSAKDSRDEAKRKLDEYTPSDGTDAAEIEALRQAYEEAQRNLTLKEEAQQQAETARNEAQQKVDSIKNSASEADGGSVSDNSGRSSQNTDELTQAQKELDDATVAWENAQKDYDAAQTAVESARAEYEAALAASGEESVINRETLETEYEAAKKALEQAETAKETAQVSYDSAVKSREAAYRSADNTLADYAVAVDNAYEAYQSALQSFNATAASAETAFTSSYNSLETAKLSADHATSELELAQLEEELGETSVKAGVDGTVTAVYATVGSPAAGLLFVIEDIDNLEVETSVKEYDIGNVKVGMPVTIRSDATGDEIYQGTITSIAPTSNKNAQGDTDTTGDIEFATKVKVDSEDTGLRIGMSVRLNYILEEQKDVLAAPYDAVYTNAQGQNCIMVLTEQESGNYLLEELPVTPGMENDLNIAVEGDGVKEGLRVVNEPDQYQALLGQEVVLTERQQTMSMYGVPMN